MKSYDRHIVWLDYFDSERKRSQGRRIPLNSCTRSPSLDELELACTRLKLEPEKQAARYPNNVSRLSGYVSIKKSTKKHQTLVLVARELSKVRGEGQSDQARFKGKS